MDRLEPKDDACVCTTVRASARPSTRASRRASLENSAAVVNCAAHWIWKPFAHRVLLESRMLVLHGHRGHGANCVLRHRYGPVAPNGHANPDGWEGCFASRSSNVRRRIATPLRNFDHVLRLMPNWL